MTGFGEGGGGFRNNTSGPIEGLEMEHPRRTAEIAAAAAERQQRRDEAKAEQTEKINKLKSIGGKVLAAAIAAGAITLLAFTGEKEKGMGIPLSQTEWEDTMKRETAGYGANISYGEDGSTIEFVEHYGDGQNYVVLIDGDNDTLIDEGHISSSKGGAEIASENGYTFKGALQLLHDKMDKEN